MADETTEILKRLAILETTTTERWLAHDKASEDHWENIRGQLDDIKASIKDLVTCKEYNSVIDGIKWQLRGLWGCVTLAGTAIFYFFVNHVSGGSK